MAKRMNGDHYCSGTHVLSSLNHIVFSFSCTQHLLDYFLLLNIFVIRFPLLSLQPHCHSGTLCALWDILPTVVLHNNGPWVIVLHSFS